MKIIMGLEMQEQEENTKVLETNIDRLTKKFVMYVKVVHHRRFITQDAPQYTVIKNKSMTKVHSTAKGSISIKKEVIGASMSRQHTTAQQEGRSQEANIHLDEDFVTINQE